MNNNVISVKNISKKFGDFTACDNLTFEIKKGEIFGFLGANGAGKTTVMKMLCGLLSPTSGSATIGGYDIYKDTENIKQNIGYMSQKFSLYEDLTIKENMEFYGGIYGLKLKDTRLKCNDFIKKFNMESVKNKLVKDIPLGWKQKTAFFVAQIHSPKIIFLDEPTGGVDPITRRQFWEMIYETADKGITIFVTTHYMDEAEYCNRISMMSFGKIIALDSPKNLKQSFNVKNIDELFLKIARDKN